MSVASASTRNLPHAAASNDAATFDCFPWYTYAADTAFAFRTSQKDAEAEQVPFQRGAMAENPENPGGCQVGPCQDATPAPASHHGLGASSLPPGFVECL